MDAGTAYRAIAFECAALRMNSRYYILLSSTNRKLSVRISVIRYWFLVFAFQIFVIIILINQLFVNNIYNSLTLLFIFYVRIMGRGAILWRIY
jgi:hypothetical protein